MTSLILVYVANIVVAGYIGVVSLFFPQRATTAIFQNAYPTTDTMRLVACLWLSIAVLSMLGLARPVAFSPVLVLQLIYKGLWLLIVAMTALRNHQPYPSGMAAFFLIWVVVLPFVIPWEQLLRR